MQEKQRTYIAIDLKSFYASVECVERNLDPLTTNLVVADESRTEKTICLAVSPSLKAYGIGGRARLFEAVQKIKEVNRNRLTPTRPLEGGRYIRPKSYDAIELEKHPDWEVDFIRAVPRMAYYIKYSTRIYQIYLKYIAPEDIHVYSIDEVFMDVTDYITSPNPSQRGVPFNAMKAAHNLARTIIQDVIKTTGITATAGIGTNMYLCKIAMDIVAKHIPADKDGVRIAELDEMTYRQKLWDHRPLTSFWRVGKGIADKLAMYGIDTMGKIARTSINNEEFLYRLFGVNAELLIDHAWGWEPCTIDYIKAYKPETNSLSTGQVLQEPYTFQKARVVVQEMAEAAALDLVDKRLVTNQLVLTVGYEAITSKSPLMGDLEGLSITTDYYGRQVPKHAHGTANLKTHSSSRNKIRDAVVELYDRIVNPNLLVRRLNLTTNHVISEEKAKNQRKEPVQLDLFTDYEVLDKQKAEEEAALAKERRIQETILKIKKQFGKNALLTGLNFADGATAKERNAQIGGHKA